MGVACAASTLQLLPGEYLWTPELAPSGPVIIVVNLAQQITFVYRNGVRIGAAVVSSGKPGFATPTGVFTILEKHREHFSNRYDNAPMPFMQRLTWDGLALHAGAVTGYPASHGCVRLPFAFSEKLFGITQQGMTVIILDHATAAPNVVYPTFFAADSDQDSTANNTPTAADAAYQWTPNAATTGALSIVLSSADHEVLVLRNGIQIGRAPVRMRDGALHGTQVYVLLDGLENRPSQFVPDRPALRWLAVPLNSSPSASASELQQTLANSELHISPAFAKPVYDALTTGTTLVITDEAIRPASDGENLTVLRADEPRTRPPSTKHQ
jgi:hypothetical protein